jgi:predicted  nucleic acid-binding Zn-ribbon protein
MDIRNVVAIKVSMRIFISHIHEDKKLAVSIKEILEEAFINIDVFVSSDDEDMTERQKWFDSVEKALEEAEVMIVMCSENSVTRSWINFEAGAGWIKGIDVYPICYGNAEVGSLPRPISEFPALSIHDDDFLEKLFRRISDSLDFDRSPPVHPNHSNMISKARKEGDKSNLGFVDRMVRINEMSGDIEKVFKNYTRNTSEVTERTKELENKINASRNSDEEASSIFVQKKSKNFASSVSEYSSKINSFADDLDKILDSFNEDVEYIIEYGNKGIREAKSEKDLLELKDQFDSLIRNYEEALHRVKSFRNVVNNTSDEASKMGGFQQDLTDSIKELKESNENLDEVLRQIEDSFEKILEKLEKSLEIIESKK